MAYIQTSTRPAVISSPVNPKPATDAAALVAFNSAPAPAAALDLSPAAKAFLGGETSNVPWGNSPVKD